VESRGPPMSDSSWIPESRPATSSSPRIPRPRGRAFHLAVGRTHATQKGLTFSARGAGRKQRDLNARLIIAGDGEMRRDWESYAKRLNLGGKVEFLGQVPWNEISPLVSKRRRFPLHEPARFPSASQVLEAMAHSLPILALDHQGVGTFVSV